uniref:Uncharacterized protein n=1 Tax=Gouania willdenowi TaxID=441366 RepID=A0A8C5HCF7_GOUWI
RFVLAFYSHGCIYFDHSVLCLHYQLFRGEVVHIQAHLPAVLGLQGSSLLCQHVSRDGRPHVPRPVCAGEGDKVLRQRRHAEGLVKDAAVLVPVPKGVPAWCPQQREGNASLCHDGFVQMVKELTWSKPFEQTFYISDITHS